MSELVVYENHDAFLEHATHTRVPLEVNTLEEFLEFVSARIAVSSGDATAAGRYRFVYSLTGKPLWRVSEFREAGKIVVSCTPGFLPRKSGVNAAPLVPLPKYNLHSKKKKREEEMVSCCHPSITSTVPATACPNQRVYSIQEEGSGGKWSSEGFVWRDFSVPNGAAAGDFFSTCGDARSRGTTYLVAGERVVLPPTPRFNERVFGGELGLSPTGKVTAVQTLISLKLVGRSFVESEVLFRDELHSILRPIVVGPGATTTSTAVCGQHAVRALVEGPPRSGVSTVLAYAACMTVSAPGNRFQDCLFLPLNFELLFDSAGVLVTSANGGFGVRNVTSEVGEKQSPVLDAPLFFLSIMRLVLDCAVAQQPSLRESSSALAQTWEQLVSFKDTTNMCFNDAHLVQILGQQALQGWSIFAVAVARILRAARDAPYDMSLRDAVVETVLVEFVAQMASALRFSGVMYIVDGLRFLSAVLQHRVLRPLGDAGVFLRCLARCPWAHIVVGVDILAIPPCSVLLPGEVQCVKLLQMLTHETLTTRYRYPASIRCGGRSFPLQLFLGAPGYMQVLHALLQGCDHSVLGAAEKTNYTLRVEDGEVLAALQGLADVLRLDIPAMTS